MEAVKVSGDPALLSVVLQSTSNFMDFMDQDTNLHIMSISPISVFSRFIENYYFWNTETTLINGSE